MKRNMLFLLLVIATQTSLVAAADQASCLKAKNDYLDLITAQAKARFEAHYASTFERNRQLLRQLLATMLSGKAPEKIAGWTRGVGSGNDFYEDLERLVPAAQKALALYAGMSDAEVKTRLGDNIHGGDMDATLERAVMLPIRDAGFLLRGSYGSGRDLDCVPGSHLVEGLCVDENDHRDREATLSHTNLRVGFRMSAWATVQRVLSRGPDDLNPSVPYSARVSVPDASDHLIVEVCTVLHEKTMALIEIDGLTIGFSQRQGLFNEWAAGLCSQLDVRTHALKDLPLRADLFRVAGEGGASLASFVAQKNFPEACR